MITCFGDLIQDILITPRGPLAKGSDVPGTIMFSGGGSASNTACWLGYLQQPVCFVGRVGPDDVGQMLRQELTAFGVEAHLAVGHEPTGRIAVLVDAQGERTMITQRGANLGMTTEDLLPLLPVDSAWLHCTGYSFFQSVGLREAALAFLDHGRRAGAKRSLDPSSYALLVDYGVGKFLDETRGADLFLPNADEARVLTGCADPRRAAEVLRTYYSQVIITLGAQGCMIADDSGVQLLPAAEAAVQDTTGAGDAFNAGVLAGLYQGKPPSEAALWGMRCASRCVAHAGGRPTGRR